MMVNKETGSAMWSLTQIQSPQLSMGSETVDAKDALGTTIMTFERAKTATFSGQSAVFDLNLLAAQAGTTKVASASDAKIKVPMFETVTLTSAQATAGKFELSKTPIVVSGVSTVTEIYKLNGDSNLGKSYGVDTAASATAFAIDGKEITLPTDAFVAGDRVFVLYEYEADDTSKNGAVQILNSANNFPTSGEFILEILGADVCNPSTKVYAYLIFPNCKLSSATDLTFETEMTQAFELTANQDYCSADSELWRLVIPEA